VVVVAVTVVDEEAVGVNATSTCTKGILVSPGITETHGMGRMAEAGITGEGDITNLRATPTLPQLQPRPTHMGGIHHKATIRISNRAGIEDHLSRRMTRVLPLNNLPTEVAEEDTIRDRTVPTAAGRMGTVEGEEALLPKEEVHRTAAAGMAVKEVKEEVMVMVVTVVDTTSPRRTVVTAEVVTTEVVDINQAGPTSPAEVINPAEVTSPVGHTAQVSSLTVTREDTTKEVEVVEEGTDPTDTGHTHIKILFRFASSIFSSCSEPTPVRSGDISPVILSIRYVPKYYM